MKNSTILKMAFCCFLLVQATSFAANWHPFPFKVACYGKPTVLDGFHGTPVLPNIPDSIGWNIAPFPLDKAWISVQSRCRGRSYAITPPAYNHSGLLPNLDFGNTYTQTNIDTSEVLFG